MAIKLRTVIAITGGKVNGQAGEILAYFDAKGTSVVFCDADSATFEPEEADARLEIPIKDLKDITAAHEANLADRPLTEAIGKAKKVQPTGGSRSNKRRGGRFANLDID